MADISSINFNNTLYNIKDSTARSDISSISTNLKNNYLPLTGGTLTGNVIFDSGQNYTGITIKGDNNAPQISIHNTGTRITIDQYAKNSTGGDRYLLPTVASQASDVWYDILTSKNPVTIAQGGTGATTAENARINLDVIKKSGDTEIGNLYLGNGKGFFVTSETTAGLQEARMYLRSKGSTNGSAINFWYSETGNHGSQLYALPPYDETLSHANYYYNILTSKNPVTVEQGGTGAATSTDACTNLGAVKKSGDTMTGILDFIQNGECLIRFRDNGVGIGDKVTSDTWIGELDFKDKNNVNCGYIGVYYNSSYETRTRIMARSTTSGTNYNTVMDLVSDINNNRRIELNSKIDTTANIYMKNTAYTIGANPSSEIWGDAVDFAGNDDSKPSGQLRMIYRTSGLNQLNLSAIQRADTTTTKAYENYLRLGVNRSGGMEVAVADRPAWAKAIFNNSLGTSASHFMAITSGWASAGYTSVSDAKTLLGIADSGWKTASLSTNISGTVGYRKIGNIVNVITYDVTLGAAVASYTYIGSVPDGYRPKYNAFGVAMAHSGADLYMYKMQVGGGGAILIYASGGTGIPANTKVSFNVTYMVP